MLRYVAAIICILVSPYTANAQSTTNQQFAVEPLGTTGCTQREALVMGQQVRLTGGGFTPGESVEFTFSCCSFTQAPTVFPLATADVDGFADTTVTVPTITDGWLDFPATAKFHMRSSMPDGPFGLQVAVVSQAGTSATADSDGDGVPDFCDNCPTDFNPSQTDVDSDGFGNSLNSSETGCDICTNDPTNDADGDGFCEGGFGGCSFDPDNDIDSDQICGNIDNCPTVNNPLQEDSDQNGIGDACQNGIPTCSDGVDNDFDGFVDFPQDPGCEDASDTTETSAAIECDDGIDNDADGLVDFSLNGSGDPGCGKYPSLSAGENPQCDDGIDNDEDGLVDFDGDFVGEPDPECGGFGFGNDETVPEPGTTSGLVATLALLAAAVSLRQRRES